MRKNSKILIILFVLALASFVIADAQQIYKLRKAVTANGGVYAPPTTPNGYRVRSTIGQIAIEKRKNSSSTDFTLYNGYWSKIPTEYTSVADDPIFEYKRIKNYPNPFSNKTSIVYELPSAARVVLVVYDVNGNEISKLVDGLQEQGQHSVDFAAIGNNGIEFSSGSYLYELKVDPAAMVSGSSFVSYSIRNVMVLVK